MKVPVIIIHRWVLSLVSDLLDTDAGYGRGCQRGLGGGPTEF